MEAAALPQAVIENFLRLYALVEEGRTGIISEAEISPVASLDRYEDIIKDPELRRLGQAVLPELVVCKLNGGLGTGMGLERAKSLLEVRRGLTFNHVVAEQLMQWREKTGIEIPLLHMTSFNTEHDIAAFMEGYPALRISGLPSYFNQHKHPKIYSDTLMPAEEAEEALNWNPPGHGDLYAALVSTGTLSRLIAAGKKYIFVSNSDNLGATPDLAILGYLAAKRLPFLLEVAERTPADRKGGHLALRKADNRLVLREAAQAPQDTEGSPCAEFQDIERYRYFNSNSEWGELEAWQRVAEANGGVIPLALIRNEKTVNPRDARSRRVYQIETAMGAAIEVFPGAGALVIPRSRFSPVKATNDLLGVRSDAYTLGADQRLALAGARETVGPPVINLDQRYYRLIDDFDARFRVIPSLACAREFSVCGDFVFNSALTICGRVVISDERSLPEKTVFDPAISELVDEKFALTDQGALRTKFGS